MNVGSYSESPIARLGGFTALPLTALLLLMALPLGVAQAAPLTARQIMEKVQARDDGDKGISELEMVLIDKRGGQRVRSIKSYSQDVGKDTQSLMFFLTPADVKGTGFLTYDYDEPGKDDDQWLYLPALKKAKRIASSDKSGSFMGTDLFYSDMTSPDLDDYNYTLEKEVEIDGHQTWQIQAVPKTGQVKEETGYEKRVAWVRQDNFVVIRSVGWVYKSQERKFMMVTKLEKIDGIWVNSELQVATKQGRDTVHQTLLRLKNVRFNQPLEKDLFTLRRLEKGL